MMVATHCPQTLALWSLAFRGGATHGELGICQMYSVVQKSRWAIAADVQRCGYLGYLSLGVAQRRA